MPKVPKPSDHEEHIFTGELTPAMLGSKWVFESEHLKIGYDRPIMEITMRIKRGQKIGILGKNGWERPHFKDSRRFYRRHFPVSTRSAIR